MALFYLTLQEKQFKAQQDQFNRFNQHNIAVASGHSEGQLRVKLSHDMSTDEYLHWLAVTVLKQGGSWLVYQQIKSYKDQFTRIELGQLQERVYDYLNERKSTLIKTMENDLEAYILDTNCLNIDGFLFFAAPTVKNWLKDIVGFEAEQLLIRREQDDFIKVLKFLVTIQEPVVEIVHIVVRDSHKFDIINEAGKDLKQPYLESLQYEDDISSISNDDLIMSMLITFIPKKIIIHHEEKAHNGAFDLVKAVFQERVQSCQGCQLCFVIKEQ